MNYKRIVQIAIISLIVSVVAVSPVLAAKPIDVQYQSNGFPSGQHFNLNLHGRDPSTYTGSPTGNAVIVALNGSSTIEYLSNKKNRNNTELVVLDSAGRMQVPKEYLEFFEIKGRARLELAEDGILIRPAPQAAAHAAGASAGSLIPSARRGEGFLNLPGRIRDLFSRLGRR